jgi:hypothetical protein
VDILTRIRAADHRDDSAHRGDDTDDSDDGEKDWATGIFSGPSRRLFENELIYGIIIGMGRLDDDDRSSSSLVGNEANDPLLHPLPDDAAADPSPYSLPESASISILEQGDGEPNDDDLVASQAAESDGCEEQAAVGRLLSMSLVAAVTANAGGKPLFFLETMTFLFQRSTVALAEETQLAFVHEVQHAGGDDIWWIRKEACFALGALAKVVPVSVVLPILVSRLPVFFFFFQADDAFFSYRFWRLSWETLLGLYDTRPSLPFQLCSHVSRATFVIQSRCSRCFR